MPQTIDALPRTRIPQACAECRRLKLKCDKKKPCSSCIRRGCPSICPDGRMVSKGSRFILANTEQLHKKVDVLINRIRQLEGALEGSHSQHSSEQHPLLSEELRLIASPLETATPEPDSEPSAAKVPEELTESMGTLTLDHHGTRYFGSTGAYAYLWRDGDSSDAAAFKFKGETSQALGGLPAEVAQLASNGYSTIVFLHFRKPGHFSKTTGSILAGSASSAIWLWTENIFSPMFHRSPYKGDKPLGHRLGLLFIVFAIGEYMDLTNPLLPSTGLRYYLLARASLGADPVLESPTVTALQAMYLLGVFLVMARGTNVPEHAWVLSGMNIKLALTLGLQHDAEKFGLPPDEVENRRLVLASVLTSEVFQSLNVGRPPAQTLTSFDWILAKERPEDLDMESPAFWRHWSLALVRDCFCKVLEATVTNKVKPRFDVGQSIEAVGISATMDQTFTSLIKETCLLLLHRRCFAIALRDFPDDPLKSPFAPSVQACHRSATSYISKIRVLHSHVPGITLRVWFIWPHVFISTLVLGSIVARSPGCSLASAALLDLESACQLWESASDSIRSAKVQTTVRKLREKAFMAFSRNRTSGVSSGVDSGGLEVLDEIHALGGSGPRVISAVPITASAPSPSEATEQISSVASSSGQGSPQVPIDMQDTQAIVDQQPWIVPNTDCSIDDPFAAINSPFDFKNYNQPSQLATMVENMLPHDFNHLFGAIDASGLPQASFAGTSILDELGLGGAWQPVIEHLGL